MQIFNFVSFVVVIITFSEFFLILMKIRLDYDWC